MGRRRCVTSLVVVAAVAIGLTSCTSAETATTSATTTTSAAATTSASTTSATVDGTVVDPPVSTTSRAAGTPDGTVERFTETFVDESRATQAGAATPAADSRTLETQIFVPGGDGPFPLIVFGHGLSGHPDVFERLLTAWGEAGYVVAAPAFPLTNRDIDGASQNWDDVANQPDDISFVLDKVLDLAERDDHPLGGRVDTERIGAAGLSLGGITTYQVGLNGCCADSRIDAVVILAARIGLADEAGSFSPTADTPVLIMHGDADPVFDLDLAVEAYALVDPPKYLVTLLGGGHAEPFQDQVTPYDEIVDAVTVDFWAAYLRDDPAATEALADDAAVDGLSTLESAR